MIVIGFATEYYTLWHKTTEPMYFTDSNDNHHFKGDKINYFYEKNISTDLNKVKELYPNAPIDNELRGKSRDFSITTPDACPEILKFGKYFGKNVSEVAEIDFDYIVWLLQNGRKETIDVCSLLPKVKEYIAKQKADELAIEENINSQTGLVSGKHTLTFSNNPNRWIGELDGSEFNFIAEFNKTSHLENSNFKRKHYAVAIPKEGSEIYVLMDTKAVNGLYPYSMGIVNGKPMKLKNKTVEVNIEILETRKCFNGTVQLAVLI